MGMPLRVVVQLQEKMDFSLQEETKSAFKP